MSSGTMNLLAQQPVKGPTFWMPSQGSTVAAEVDWLFYFVMYLCYFFFFLIAVVMFWFAWKYRYRPGVAKPPAPATHNTALEMLWTVPPLFVVLFIAYKGFAGYMDMSVPPPNTYDILVTGRTWSWSFTYPNGTTTAELHLPKGVPVKFTLTSDDVIHSLFVPNWRLKKDVVPGRYNQYWVNATEAGVFDVYCAEYCGRDHSMMNTKVTVHETTQMFMDWLADASVWEPKVSFVERGEQLYTQRGCSACHSIDGSKNTGPTWKDAFGATHQMANGESVLVDENYIRESIYYPGRKVVAGYANQMPAFLGQLTENDITAIIWYMKSLSSNVDQSQIPTGTAAEVLQAASGESPATQPAGSPN